jgi:hypothetical protein
VSTVHRGFFLISGGLLIERHRMLPRWTGLLALVVGAASRLGILSISLHGGIAIAWLVGLSGFVRWTLVLGITSLVLVLLRSARSRH